MWYHCFVILLVAVAATPLHLEDQLQSDEIIEAVNAAHTTWTAGRNFHQSLKRSYIKNLVGAVKKPLPKHMQIFDIDEDSNGEDLADLVLPVNFDARKKWKFCNSIQEVRDQGSCGSCWAVSTSSTFSDRLCIATNGSFNGHLSAQQLMSCCDWCGSGCGGGSPLEAWDYFQTYGLVSGGGYESKEGCQPYTVPECEHYVTGLRKKCSDIYVDYLTPKCQNTCYNQEYKEKGFYDDLHKVKNILGVASFDPEKHNLAMKMVQKEIFNNGPLTTSFTVYEDFLAYKKGVYHYVTGKEVYGHAVKVIGWGEEEGTPYWLVSNSWNSDWGDNGFFKIRRGNNECGFEDIFHGGMPDVSEYKL